MITLVLPATDEERATLGATERRVTYFDTAEQALEVDPEQLPPEGAASATEHLVADDGEVVWTTFYDLTDAG